MFQFGILEWIQGQVAYLNMPPLWIDYFYDESSREATISVKNADAQNRSFNDLVLQLKFPEVFRLDSLRAYYNTSMIAISVDSIKTSNQKDYYFYIRRSLHLEDFFLLRTRIQGSISQAESAAHPEIVVRGTGVSVAYSKQDRILKNYSLSFKIGGWVVLTLILVCGGFGSAYLFYEQKCEFLASRLEEIEESSDIEDDSNETDGNKSQKTKKKTK